jgi:hypothetical protein
MDVTVYDKIMKDGVTQLCLNGRGVGCRKDLELEKFNTRRRERADGTFNYSFEKLCIECQKKLAREQAIKHGSPGLKLNNPAFECKRKDIVFARWEGLDKLFFLDLAPTDESVKVNRYQL